MGIKVMEEITKRISNKLDYLKILKSCLSENFTKANCKQQSG